MCAALARGTDLGGGPTTLEPEKGRAPLPARDTERNCFFPFRVILMVVFKYFYKIQRLVLTSGLVDPACLESRMD